VRGQCVLYDIGSFHPAGPPYRLQDKGRTSLPGWLAPAWARRIITASVMMAKLPGTGQSRYPRQAGNRAAPREVIPAGASADDPDVLRLWPLLALRDVELDFLPLKAGIAATGGRAECTKTSGPPSTAMKP
jgi:hypothetical protein